MKKTCALFGVGLIGSMVGYYYAIDRFLPEIGGIPVLIFSLIGGFSVLALFGALSSLVQSLSDKAVIGRALKGQPFRDGKRAAALGRIEPAGLSSVTAPFSGKDCLAYEFEVYEFVRVPGKGSHTRKEVHCSGFGMTPSVIRCPQGDIRLLGFPILDEWPKDIMEDADRQRAIQFLKQTSFLDIKKDIGSAFSEFDDLFRDADGAVHKNFGAPVEIENKHSLAEVGIPRGAEVCAIGVYSKQNNALFAKNAALPIRLVPGSAKEAEQRLRKTSMGHLVFGLAFFAVFNGILAIAYFGIQKDRFNIPASQQYSALEQAGQADDFDRLRKLVEKGISPDATDSHSRTLLQTTPDDRVAKLLLELGANPEVQDPETLETPLFEAARKGNLGRMKILIDGGAKVNAVSTIPWAHTPIDEAIRYGQAAAAEALIQAGAPDPRITAANGQQIVEAGSNELAVCNKYLQAIQAQDTATMRSITTPRYDHFFEDIALDLWKAAYPLSIASFEGYSNDSGATISLRGNRADGRNTEWIFQLENNPEGWKIHQAWPITGEGPEVVWR